MLNSISMSGMKEQLKNTCSGSVLVLRTNLCSRPEIMCVLFCSVFFHPWSHQSPGALVQMMNRIEVSNLFGDGDQLRRCVAMFEDWQLEN